MVQFSHSRMSDSLWLKGLQHTRPPCPSPAPRACSNSCPSSRWCHPTISPSVVPFSSCLPSSIPAKWSSWPDKHDGVITHLEPDILECEVKWALGSITMNKASGGDGIPAELFEILKDDAVKVLHSIYQQIWKTQQWPQDWKRSAFIPIPKKGNAKESSNYCTIAFIS